MDESEVLNRLSILMLGVAIGFNAGVLLHTANIWLFMIGMFASLLAFAISGMKYNIMRWKEWEKERGY